MRKHMSRPRTSLCAVAAATLLLFAVPAGAEVGVVYDVHPAQVAHGPYELRTIIEDADPVGSAWRLYSPPGSPRVVLNPQGEENRDGDPFSTFNEHSGLPVVTWATKTATGYDVVLSYFAGGSWSQPVVLAAGASTFADPEPVLAVNPDDGSMHLLYWTDDTWPKVMHREAPADLSSWSDPLQVSQPGEMAVRPWAVFVDGVLHVSYEDHAGQLGGAPRQIVLAVQNGSGFSSEVIASTNFGDRNWPRVHVAADKLWIDWIDDDGVMAWTRRNLAGSWDPIQTETFASVEERDFQVRQRIRSLATE